MLHICSNISRVNCYMMCNFFAEFLKFRSKYNQHDFRDTAFTVKCIYEIFMRT